MTKDEAMQQALEKVADALPAYIDGVAAREYLAVIHKALEQQPRPEQQQARVDVITVTLMREGINKHRARELADHFVNITLPPPLPMQEPWGACVSGRVFVGALPQHVRKLTEDDGLPIQWLYTTPPAAQRPWQGLTEDEKFEMAAAQYGWEDLLIAAEAKLKDKNHG